MPLTRPYEETIKERAQWDPVYRAMLLPDTIDLLLADDVRVGKIALHSCIYATIGYEKLAELMAKSPDDIKRMCHPDYDTSVDDLFEIIWHIQQHEGIRLEVKVCSGKPDGESVAHDKPAEPVESQQTLHPVSPS